MGRSSAPVTEVHGLVAIGSRLYSRARFSAEDRRFDSHVTSLRCRENGGRRVEAFALRTAHPQNKPTGQMGNERFLPMRPMSSVSQKPMYVSRRDSNLSNNMLPVAERPRPRTPPHSTESIESSPFLMFSTLSKGWP